jgi:hypothetical protein
MAAAAPVALAVGAPARSIQPKRAEPDELDDEEAITAVIMLTF